MLLISLFTRRPFKRWRISSSQNRKKNLFYAFQLLGFSCYIYSITPDGWLLFFSKVFSRLNMIWHAIILQMKNGSSLVSSLCGNRKNFGNEGMTACYSATDFQMNDGQLLILLASGKVQDSRCLICQVMETVSWPSFYIISFWCWPK